MCKLRKPAVSCIFVLLAIGLFLTCEDPSNTFSGNPFSNNLGEKVVVEPPTINVESPVSGAYISSKGDYDPDTGVMTFAPVTLKGRARAYIKVEKVEMYVFENIPNGQREVKWTDKGIKLSGDLKNKTWTFDFDPNNYNNWDFDREERATPKDGVVRMLFRVFDSTGNPVESVPLVYIIKNRPSVVKMAYPNEDDIRKASEPAKVQYDNDIRGTITDRRGLRPGYPQIKLWPVGKYTAPDGTIYNYDEMEQPPDDDPKWGYASLFLSDIDRWEYGPGDDPALAYGVYADRSQMRVVNGATFHLHLADYTIVPDSKYPDNPDLRRIRYTVDGQGMRKPFPPNAVFKFIIRTRDVAPDPLNGSIPSADPNPIDPNDPPWIEGFFPPRDFGTSMADNFFIRRIDDHSPESAWNPVNPVTITIFNSDSKLAVEINNDDIKATNPGALDEKPNIYILENEKTSYKIEKAGFRLRLRAFYDGEGDDSTIKNATLEWRQKNDSDPSGYISGKLTWDGQTTPDATYAGEINPNGSGKIFTFTTSEHSEEAKNFKNSTVRYELIFKVWEQNADPAKPSLTFSCYVYIDGKGPTVNIRSVHGAADVKAPEGSKMVSYTVNGNIQPVVDSRDENSIMAYRDGGDLGEKAPPESDSMVKWIVDTATAAENEPLATSAVMNMLKTYSDSPTWDNLREFKAITDSLRSSLTNLPSGWVRRPLPDSAAQIEADKNNHFKLNTGIDSLTGGTTGYYWLYVIAMDQVQNLGYTYKKIYVDQDTDSPDKDIQPLSRYTTQAGSPSITNKDELNVIVTLTNPSSGVFSKSGNWDANARSNVLDKDDNIILNFKDDDGINLSTGGVTIVVTDLNTPSAPNKTIEFSNTNPGLLWQLFSPGEASVKDLSGTLSQRIMATAFYGVATDKLKDGKYQIDFTITDDLTKKVKIGNNDRYPPQTIEGDNPAAVTKNLTYYFAVSTQNPVITITSPEIGTKASSTPIDIKGTVKSRFEIQGMWIKFDPNVVAYSGSSPNPPPSYINLDMTQSTQDAEGYYIYNWQKEGVIFNPSGFTSTSRERRFTVVAYDQLGNSSLDERVLQVDNDPPIVTLVSFNYFNSIPRRAPDQISGTDGTGKPTTQPDTVYVYGKVPFIVTASDGGGLFEEEVNGVPMSAIKWWVLEENATPPNWDTPYPVYTKTSQTPDKWTGGGYFRDDQKKSGGQYTGIIDTRYLADKPQKYRLYIIARDNAGNLNETPLMTVIKVSGNEVKTFTVDQSRDHPVIYENVISPKPGNVVDPKDLVISGRVYDADLFDPAPATTGIPLNKTYVQIRFPSLVDPITKAPTAWPNTWIPIDIPSTYGLAGIDPGNAIVYRYNATGNTYFSDDGPKYYQIRVTDEPDAGTEGKNYGKNPDEFMRNNAAYPGYNAIYQKHDKISIVFPKNEANPLDPNPSESYKFFVDNTDPEIYFNMYDPDPKHIENYSADRPTFSNYEQLLKALSNDPKKGTGNYVKEYKLRNLTMTWSAGNNTTPFIKILVSNPEDPKPPYANDQYFWDTSKFSKVDDDKLKALFNAAPQGMQIISFEATDMVSHTGRTTWTFYKDTQGPAINFSNINRAIKRDFMPTGVLADNKSFTDLTNATNNNWPSDWPTNRHTTDPAVWKNGATAISAWSDSWQTTIKDWPADYALLSVDQVKAALTAEGITPPATFPGDWPSDWPSGTVWKSGVTAKTGWIGAAAWQTSWQTIIKYWPSEYAFRTAKEVFDALTAENDRYASLSTVIGDDITPPVIKGTFDDEYSSVTASTDAYFYYRFRDKEGKLQTTPAPTESFDSGLWFKNKIEGGQNAKSANWEITLDAAHGFGGTDGENWVDIRVEDVPAGNVSEIFNVAFLVDRAPPLLGRYQAYDNNSPIIENEFRISKIKGTTPDPAHPNLVLPAEQRVFSAAGADADDTSVIFQVSGRVNDYNLNYMKITIGQDGSTAYTVTSEAFINLNASTSTYTVTYKDSDNYNTGGHTRLTLSGPYIAGTITSYTSASVGVPEWEWTLDILGKDAFRLRQVAGIGSDAEFSTRRFIRVTASDKAGKSVPPVEWPFYLDSRRPVIEYSLDKGRSGTSFASDVKLSGLVSDDTKIRNLFYIIGKWNYATKAWNWYDGSGWTLTAPPPPPTSSTSSTDPRWANYFTDDSTPARLTTMDFTIDNDKLNATNKYPQNMLNTEGQYRLDLYVTDWSYGSGNPHNTTLANNDENDAKAFQDYDTAGVLYNAKTDKGNVSARVFYFDKEDPVLRWAEAIENKTYFRNEEGDNKGQVIFGFIAGDGNTLQKWEAVVRKGTETIPITIDGTIWQNGTTPPAQTAIPVPFTADYSDPATTAGQSISVASTVVQYFEIKPFMTTTGTGAGNALDVGQNPLPTYSITITVTDGAGRTSSIIKQFTLDNTPPKFDKFSPPSFKSDDKNTWDAVSGKFNIRGNTSDNSNQLKRVAFYVVNRGNDTNFSTTHFPNLTNPDAISETPPAAPNNENFWHWHDPKNAGRYKIDIGGTTFLEIEDGTFAWNIKVPQTSLFLSDANAKKYVQWTKTGGIPIAGPSKPGDPDNTVTALNYLDLDTGTWTAASKQVPALTFPDLNNPYTANPKQIYGGEDVGLITVYVLAEDAAGNFKYDAVKYWIWPEGDRPIVTAINSPDSTKIEAERLLNGTIRLSGMAKDNERVKNVWFRVFPAKNGKPDGAPYTLEVPVWKETDSTGINEAANLQGNPIGGNWDERGTAKQTAVDAAPDANNNTAIGAKRNDDSFNSVYGVTTVTGGWYKANGGNSKEVSWWVYINTKGEMDPQGTDSKREFIVEVRAQDVTWDDSLNNNQGGWRPYTPNYKGFVSVPLRVNAWVVAGAPIFEKDRVASVPSNAVISWDEKETGSDIFKYSIDRIHLRNRSSYKVTVKHSSGLSSIRWSPTQWVVNTANPNGIFQANPNLDTFNLLDLLSETTQSSVYVRRNTANNGYELDNGTQITVFSDMEYPKNLTTTPRMALTIDRNSMKTGSSVSVSTTKNYLILKWDTALASILPTSITGDNSYYEAGRYPGNPDSNTVTFKDLKNTVFTPKQTSGNIGNAIIIEASEPENGVSYYKWDVFVDVRADLLLADMLKDDPAYGNGSSARTGQTKDSVRYPVYLSASEVSKATPLTSRGDALLPIDNLPPYGMYTLNRKPAGTAVTIGGEAGDDGPVNGIARVVVWFMRTEKDAQGNNVYRGVSWHETASNELPVALRNGKFTEYKNAATPTPSTPPGEYTSGGPVWWEDFTPNTTKYPGALKPAIGKEDKGSGGDSAIVIDTPSPSVGKAKWGHTLPMGFSDGGLGKIWYVEINSYGIKSGPVDMHYVVIDKAGNYTHYREKLVIMNGVAVIDRIKLATDIRHNTGFPAGHDQRLAGAKINDKVPLVSSQWPLLNAIRDAVPQGGEATDINDDVKKGISDWIPASALGAGKVIDFNVRNNFFALRIETTKPPLDTTDDYARTFRLEYVSGGTLLTSAATADNRKLTAITAGKIYVINDPGTAKWGVFGAEGDESAWKKRGYAFIATISGSDLDQTAKDNIGTGSVWELTTSLPLSTNTPNPTTAESAEFRYGTGAFSTIVDNTGPTDTAFPPTPNANYTDWTNWDNAHNWSLFILRVFDGPETNYFGDFNILRVRVNNDDKSPPFAQLYDVNPKTEGEDRSNIAGDSATVEERRNISPMFIGEGTGSNRTKGGLWNISPTLGAIEKPGHIEPRRMNGAGYGTLYTSAQSGELVARNHSLSSAQMGGAPTSADATITKPWANPAGFFAETTANNVSGGDTVSGRVILRGYAEDDQRVHRVSLVINNDTANPIIILDYPSGGTVAATPADSATYMSPKTGMLSIPAARIVDGKPTVYYTDSIDLYRHRVEWAYIWDTETIPGGSNVVGNNISVAVISYPRNGATGATPKTNTPSPEIRAPGTAHTNDTEANRPNTSPYNPGFPVGLNKYNRINFNLRPYISGFLRNKTLFSHDTRSRQGRYMFYRGETAVLKGFNLGSGTMKINNGTDITTSSVTAAADLASYGIATANNNRYRQFTLGTGAVTGNGLVTYSLSTRDAVNTGGERTKATNTATLVRPTYIQPWNIEYSPGIDGSTLWDDFTQVHIWQSNDTNNGADRGYFPKTQANSEVFDPSMSIDPATGDLWTSHNEGGFGNGSNSGSTKVGNNNGKGVQTVASFIDPIINSDIYISPRQSGYDGNNNAFTVWTAYSIIGKPGGGTAWNNFGGIWISGPQGGNPTLTQGVPAVTTNNGFTNRGDISAVSQYMAESTFYNSQERVDPAFGPTLNQFASPHIIVNLDGDNERIHVSYYDTKDKSIKYRYNLRNAPGTVSSNNTALRTWVNLDGGSDAEDTVIVSTSRGIDAGESNSIALTSAGYPVVAYFDKTNQKIKLAISNNTVPTAANNWTITDNVISDAPAGRQNTFKGTGTYVSMRIDTRQGATQNTVHIAAMNSMTKSLVYIKGRISGTTYTCDSVQVVDSVGSVGRWCSISLDDQANPWISYQDESYQGSRDGIKLAYYNSDRYYKGSSTYRVGEDKDMNNVRIEGWEAMHVPTQFRVENARQGMENYPTRNFTGTRNPQTKFWRGAVGYLGQDYFRAAYYVE